MNIEQQFNLIAKEYDDNRRKFIPCFDDFYRNTTEFIVSNIDKPRRIIDLGAGTGLLTYFWYQQCPDAAYVLVDIAEEMLEIAHKRFVGIENISYRIEDYSHKLPQDPFDIVISALSIHHLEDRDKEKLFAKIYDSLPGGGLFINYDQFCAGQTELDCWFDTYWESRLTDSGLTDQDIALWKERRKLDRECSVEQEVDMLQRCGFSVVKCVYSYQKFSVIIAVKGKEDSLKRYDAGELISHLDQLHTTEQGTDRIKSNLSLHTDDVIAWCKEKIKSSEAVVFRKGKNWYIRVEQIVLTVNAHSYTVITAHKQKERKNDLSL